MARTRPPLLCSLLALTALTWSTPSLADFMPFDPYSAGTLTFSFDVIRFTPDGYFLNVNAYSRDPRCRQLSGWNIGWSFPGQEFVWGAKGAYAQITGDCKNMFPGGAVQPYSCIKSPQFMDNRDASTTGRMHLLKPAPACARDACGVLRNGVTIVVGNGPKTVRTFKPPRYYKLKGFKCSPLIINPRVRTACPTKSIISWRVECTPKPKA